LPRNTLAPCSCWLTSILLWLWPLRGQNTIRKNVLDHSLRGAECEGMMIAIPAPHWALFRDFSDQEFASALHELASSVDLSKYQKHPRGPKKKPPERAPYQNGQHVSTAKLIAQR